MIDALRHQSRMLRLVRSSFSRERTIVPDNEASRMIPLTALPSRQVDCRKGRPPTAYRRLPPLKQAT
jgi:hypothetical protein